MRAGTRLLAIFAVIAVSTGGASAQDRWPAAAEKRFDEATAAQKKGDYARAGAIYGEVAEWPDGGKFPQRAQALFCAGLAFELAADLPRALACYGAVPARWPGSEFAPRAREAADHLAPPGTEGLEFRRRLAEARELLLSGIELDGKSDEAVRPKLEQAERLLAALLAQHREHPFAYEVALALGDARMLLKDFSGARGAFADAALLARREAEKAPPRASAVSAVATAELELNEATFANRRRWLDRIAKAILPLVLLVVVATASPRGLTKGAVRLWAACVAGCASLAGLAFGLASYVKNSVDDHSPLEARTAAIIVLLPGLLGITVAIAIARGRKPRALLGGAVGALAAAALAVIIVYANGLVPLLD